MKLLIMMSELSNYFKNSLKPNIIIIIVFLFYFFSKILEHIRKGFSSISNWVYNDWLIDYSSGFVRRGLSGEFIKFLSTYLNHRLIVGVLIWGIFFGLAYGYLRLIFKLQSRLSSILLISLLFLPSLILFYLYDYSALGRKETLGFLFLLFHLMTIEKIINPKPGNKNEHLLIKYSKNLSLVTLIFLPVHVFIHESSFLLFVPIHLIITYQVFQYLGLEKIKKWLYLIISYFIVFISFFIVYSYGRPDFDTAYSICNNLELREAIVPGSCNNIDPNSMWALPSAITALPWSLSQALSLTLSFTYREVISWVIVFGIFGISTSLIGILLIVETSSRQNKDNHALVFLNNRRVEIILLKYFVLPLIVSTPLYFLGWDIGRWFSVTCINFILIALSTGIYSTEVNNCKGFSFCESQDFLKISENRKGRNIIFVILIISILFFIRLPHCCIGNLRFINEPIRTYFLKIIEMMSSFL